MTAEYILRAAIRAMEQGRPAHCFRAHVIGQGYVNDGSAQYDRADYIRQLVRSATSEVDNMGWATEYAEPGYTQPAKGILFANWNNFPRGLDTLLERYGYGLEWSDEWTTCESCNRAVRTSPDSYYWTPAYELESDNELLCTACHAEEHKYDE